VISYWPFIVTFTLSLHVSETLLLFVLQHATFPHPTSSLLKISPCSPGIMWMAFGLRRANVLGELSVQLVSQIYNLRDSDPPKSQTDGQTDRPMDDMQLQDHALHYSASHGKKSVN